MTVKTCALSTLCAHVLCSMIVQASLHACARLLVADTHSCLLCVVIYSVGAGLGPLQGGGLSRGLTDVSAGIKRIIDRIGERCCTLFCSDCCSLLHTCCVVAVLARMFQQHRSYIN
jgi:hypothetical protein